MPLPEDSKQRVLDAVNRAGKLMDVDLQSAQSYLRGYHAIKELGSRTCYSNTYQIMALAYTAYGWMPTILKNIAPDEELKTLGDFIATSRQWQLNEQGGTFIWPKDITLRAINKSVVGTSKLLHFAVPSLFPIWDSRIANIFSIRTQNKINNCENYKEYFALLHEFLHNDWQCPQNIVIALNQFGNDISRIRQLEFCLFVSGGPEPGIDE